MNRVICADCRLELELETMGVFVVQTRTADEIPYKLWKADGLTCQGCGYGVLANFAQEAYLDDSNESSLRIEIDRIARDTPHLLFYYHERLPSSRLRRQR